jgi:hypothetical protein
MHASERGEHDRERYKLAACRPRCLAVGIVLQFRTLLEARSDLSTFALVTTSVMLTSRSGRHAFVLVASCLRVVFTSDLFAVDIGVELSYLAHLQPTRAPTMAPTAPTGPAVPPTAPPTNSFCADAGFCMLLDHEECPYPSIVAIGPSDGTVVVGCKSDMFDSREQRNYSSLRLLFNGSITALTTGPYWYCSDQISSWIHAGRLLVLCRSGISRQDYGDGFASLMTINQLGYPVDRCSAHPADTFGLHVSFRLSDGALFAACDGFGLVQILNATVTTLVSNCPQGLTYVRQSDGVAFASCGSSLIRVDSER